MANLTKQRKPQPAPKAPSFKTRITSKILVYKGHVIRKTDTPAGYWGHYKINRPNHIVTKLEEAIVFIDQLTQSMTPDQIAYEHQKTVEFQRSLYHVKP